MWLFLHFFPKCHSQFVNLNLWASLPSRLQRFRLITISAKQAHLFSFLYQSHRAHPPYAYKAGRQAGRQVLSSGSNSSPRNGHRWPPATLEVRMARQSIRMTFVLSIQRSPAGYYYNCAGWACGQSFRASRIIDRPQSVFMAYLVIVVSRQHFLLFYATLVYHFYCIENCAKYIRNKFIYIFELLTYTTCGPYLGTKFEEA